MRKDDLDKSRKKEWERNPMINLADSVSRSMVGDLSALRNGGCLTNIITLVIVVIGLLILSRCAS